MFPRITAFLEPLKHLPPYVDEDGDTFSFHHTLMYALDVYPQEFDVPEDHDDPQEFAQVFLADNLYGAYEEDSEEYRAALFDAFHRVCADAGIHIE